MIRKIFLAIALSLSFITCAAIAEQAYINIEQKLTSEQLRETGLDTLTAEQLKKLNQILSAENIRIVENKKISASEHGDNHRQFIGLSDKPIKSRLVGNISGWDVDTVFELENGQRWKVLKGYMTLRKPMTKPEILVVPGIAGRWFLQVDEDLPKARVYRID